MCRLELHIRHTFHAILGIVCGIHGEIHDILPHVGDIVLDLTVIGFIKDPEKKSFEYLCIQYPNKKNELTKFRELKKRYFKIERTLSNYDNFNNISDDKILRKEYNQIRKELKRNGYRDNRMIRKSRLTTNIIVFILCAIMIFSCIIILPLLIFTIPILIKMIRK